MRRGVAERTQPSRSACAALLLLAVAALGCPRSPRPEEPAPGHEQVSFAESVGRGRIVYEERCRLCHGGSGRGDGPLAAAFDPPPADLRASKLRVSFDRLPVVLSAPHYSRTQLEHAIREGQGGMPAWADTLSEEEIVDVSNYLKATMDAPDASGS